MTAPLGLIAGLGDLPVAVAENAVATGEGVYVLRLKGFEEPRLAAFPGAVIIVSHDRFFVEKVAFRQLSFDGHGSVKEIAGVQM